MNLNMSTMSPTEEETIKLLNAKFKIKAIEWDVFINRLKTLSPVPDAELEEKDRKGLSGHLRQLHRRT